MKPVFDPNMRYVCPNAWELYIFSGTCCWHVKCQVGYPSAQHAANILCNELISICNLWSSQRDDGVFLKACYLYQCVFMTLWNVLNVAAEHVCSYLLTLVPRLRIFLPWRWSRYVPPKRRFTQEIHGAISQKTAFFIFHRPFYTLGIFDCYTKTCSMWCPRRSRTYADEEWSCSECWLDFGAVIG
jgi:hypothetical protein